MVFIHGWGCDATQFAGLARAFEATHRIFRPDLPGHGRTPLGSFAPGFATYAAAVADFILEQGLDRPVLVGHSMGGVLMLMAAASGRIRPRALVNLDGGLPPAKSTLTGQALICSWLDLPDFREKLARVLRENFFLPHERDARCEAIIQAMCSAPEPVLRFLPTEVGTLDASAILPRIAAPSLYIAGAKPRFDPEAAARFPGMQIEQIPGSGHFPHLYAEEETAGKMKTFLAGLDGK